MTQRERARSVLDELRALGGDTFVEEVLAEFRIAAPDLLQEVAASLTTGDVDAFHRGIHSLGTLALTVDRYALGSACRQLELRSRHAIPDDAASALADIRALMGRASNGPAACTGAGERPRPYRHTVVWIGPEDDVVSAAARASLARRARGRQAASIATVREASAFFTRPRLLIVVDTAHCGELEASIRRLRSFAAQAVLIGWAADPRDASLDAALRAGADAVAGGHAPAWARVLRDARGRAEARRRLDEEAHFRRFFEHATLPAAVAAADGRIVAANAALARAVGRHTETLVGLDVLTLFEPGSSGLASIDAILTGEAEHAEAEVRLTKPSGGGGTTSVRLFRTRLGSARSTDRIFLTLDRHCPASPDAERQQAVFVHAGVGLAASGFDSPWADVNPAMQRMFGQAARISRNTLLEMTHPEDRLLDFELFEELLAGSRESYQIEKRYIHPDTGAVLWCLLIVSLERDAVGVPQTVFATVVDITEKKLAEERLCESQARLFNAQKLEAIGRLTGGVAHDLNNMLMAVEFNLHDLRSIEVPAAARSAITDIEAATARARRLTQQLLATSRSQHLEPARLDLNGVVRGMARMIDTLVGTGIELRCELDESLPEVLVDESQLEQVILNLVVNARDAMPDGGVLTLRTAGSPAEAPGAGRTEPASFATLVVQDTGIGMSRDVQKRIFEPFFSTKPLGKGTGLGLSTVAGIVAQSGGEIRVQSEPGKGTTFHVDLPLAPDSQPAAADTSATYAEPAAAGRPAGRRTVLLVEDESLIREIVRRTLEREGYEVLTAGSPETALRLARDFGGRLDAIVTDVVMPGGDGRALAATLANAQPDLKVLLMSGFVPDADPRAERPSGWRFLQKPIEPAVLSRTLRELLGQWPSAG